MSETPAADSGITTERRGHVLCIGINRPEKRNAFNLEMLQALGRAYAQLETDDELRCGVLFAHGDHFTAGLDLAEMAPHVSNETFVYPDDALDPLALSERRTKPLVAAAQGWCLTLGIELLLAADIRVAATDTRFAQIEIKRGIYPFGGATIRLPREAGWGNAMRWLLTGDQFGAQEAHRIGLVQEVVGVGDQLATAVAIAERISAQAPLGVRATLQSASRAITEGEQAAASRLQTDARALFATEDAREGLQSFLQRREASFVGR